MAEFSSKLERQVAAHGPLCVGIDPSAATLAQCDLPDNAEGALAFGRRVLEAADYRLAIVKPQSAYFERFGAAGVRALEQLAALARERDVLVLLDAKRGDIDTTGEAYAEAYFAPSSPLRVDAMTLHAYLGFGALDKAIAFAARHGAGVFVVVRSSNPEGAALQNARVADGRTVAQSLSDEITAMNRRFGAGLGPVGAVVGATCEDADETARRLPLSWILAPGVGAQGATLEDVLARMPAAKRRVLPSLSRAILAGGSGASEMRATISKLRDRARALFS